MDVKNFNGRWFVASDAGVFEIVDTGHEDPWLAKIEPMAKPQPGQVVPDAARELQMWRDEAHSDDDGRPDPPPAQRYG